MIQNLLNIWKINFTFSWSVNNSSFIGSVEWNISEDSLWHLCVISFSWPFFFINSSSKVAWASNNTHSNCLYVSPLAMFGSTCAASKAALLKQTLKDIAMFSTICQNLIKQYYGCDKLHNFLLFQTKNYLMTWILIIKRFPDFSQQ